MVHITDNAPDSKIHEVVMKSVAYIYASEPGGMTRSEIARAIWIRRRRVLAALADAALLPEHGVDQAIEALRRNTPKKGQTSR